MKEIEKKIYEFISNQNLSEIWGDKKISVKKLKPIGIGTGNLNILVVLTNKKKVVFRFSINKSREDMFIKESLFLKSSKGKKFLPGIIYSDTSYKNLFKRPFMMIDYIIGSDLSKIKYRVSSTFISNLAKEVAKIHRLKGIRKIVKKDSIFGRIENRIKFLKNKISPENYENIMSLYRQMPRNKELKAIKTITHANLWEGNIIKNNKELKIIDYETICLDDPAIDIAHIFHDFKTGYLFSEKQKLFFIKEYKKHRKDLTLEKRLNFLLVFDVFDSFLRILEYTVLSKEADRKDPLKKSMADNSGKKSILVHFNKLKKFNIIGKKTKLKDLYSFV